MKSLMYHYIRDDSEDFPFSAHKRTDEFIDEVGCMKKIGFTFSNPTDAISHSRTNGIDCADEKVIILTFDDGLKDHLTAAKLLKSNGISCGGFYIPTLPYTDGAILAVHKAQYIRSRFGGKSLMLLEDASSALGINLINHNKYTRLKEEFKGSYSSQLDDDNTKEFKRLINYYGDLSLRDVLLDKILETSGLSVSFQDVYLSKAEILEISQMGFEIGSHGSTHTPLSRLSPDQQRFELLSSKVFLQDLIGKEIHSFCYPYGGKSSYNVSTLELLQEIGYKNAISEEPREISDQDLANFIFEIPRYDCNMISSLFSPPAWIDPAYR